jgi:hypothetical protein
MRRLLALASFFGILSFPGCRWKSQDPEAFIREYRSSLEVSTIRGDYRFTTFFASPEYLAAIRNRNGQDTMQGKEKSRAADSNPAYYMSLSIRAAHPMPGSEISQDLLNSTVLSGRAEFSQRLRQLETGLQSRCYLELPDGTRIFPSVYYFDRNWGLRDSDDFLFVFPKIWNGKSVPISYAKFVVGEFGLSLGNIVHEIKVPRA